MTAVRGAHERRIDMIHGPMWTRIFFFAMTIAVTTMLQQLFNTADVIVLGHFVNDEAMAAVGNSVPIIGIIVNLFLGLSLGANVIVARYMGMSDPRAAAATVKTSVTLSVIWGVAIAILMELTAPLIMLAMGVPAEVFAPSERYLRIFVLGLPCIGVYNFEAAMFRSRGDATTPLIALALGSAANVAGNLLVVVGLHQGIGAVALTTVLSNFLCTGYLFFKMSRERGELQLRWLQLLHWPERRTSRAIMRIGIPAALQGMIFALSNLIIQAAINSLGPLTMAASAAAFTVEINVYCFISSFGLAATTYVSQNYGAGDLARCRRATAVCLILDFFVTLAIVTLIWLFARPVLGLFTTNEAVIAIGMIRIFYVVLPQPLNVGMEVLPAAMRGYGFSLPPALLSLFCVCLIRIVWVFTVFRWRHDYPTLMQIYPLSWWLTSTALIAMYVYQQRHVRRCPPPVL